MTKEEDGSVKNIKAVFFDYDDTLVNSLEAKWAHHKHVAKIHYGKILTDEEIRKHWTNPFSQLVGLLYGDEDLERAMKNNIAHEDAFPKMLLADAILTLERLHDRAILTGIVTSTSRRSLMRDLARYEFPDDLVDYIQTEDDTKYHKPDSKVFEPLLDWLTQREIEPDHVLYVGDGLHDMKAALGAGFNFVGVTTGIVTAEEFRAAGGESIETLSALQHLIK